MGRARTLLCLDFSSPGQVPTSGTTSSGQGVKRGYQQPSAETVHMLGSSAPQKGEQGTQPNVFLLDHSFKVWVKLPRVLYIPQKKFALRNEHKILEQEGILKFAQPCLPYHIEETKAKGKQFTFQRFWSQLTLSSACAFS